MVVIDQHALHERILYEQLRERVLAGALESQDLLVPEPVDLSPAEAAAALERATLLAQVGHQGRAVRRRHGAGFELSGHAGQLSPGRSAARPGRASCSPAASSPSAATCSDSLLHMISCKAAIKAGDRLTRRRDRGPVGAAAPGPGHASLPPRPADGPGFQPRGAGQAVQADVRSAWRAGSCSPCRRYRITPRRGGVIIGMSGASGASDGSTAARSLGSEVISISSHVRTIRHHDLRQHWPRPAPARDCRAPAPGRAGGPAGRTAAGLHQRRGEPQAAAGRPALPGGHHLPPRARRRQVHRQRGAAAAAAADRHRRGRRVRRPGRRRRRRRSRVSARPSGSSACTTSARRPTTSTRSTPGCASSTPTSSRSPRWPTIRTTTCGCCSWSRRSKVPTIGLCMGDIGIPSRILAGKFGAPFTYATFHHERTLAPGQLSFQQMTEIYHYDQINADTEVYGVIADPIGHSLSPLIHNAAFRQPGAEQGLRAVPRAARGPGAVHRRRAGAGHPRAERHDSAQGRGASRSSPRPTAASAASAPPTRSFSTTARSPGYNTDYQAAHGQPRSRPSSEHHGQNGDA